MRDFNPLAYYQRPLDKEAQKRYDENWQLIFGKKDDKKDKKEHYE